jgi:hypothetical protein
MTDLYQMADFYLCTSAAEGQGLPVQEAMANGAVPISPCETAMLDYITEENAVILATEIAPLPLQVTDAYALGTGQWRIADYREVSKGLAKAAQLPADEYARRSRAAAQIIKEKYGYSYVMDRVRERMTAGACG